VSKSSISSLEKESPIIDGTPDYLSIGTRAIPHGSMELRYGRKPAFVGLYGCSTGTTGLELKTVASGEQGNRPRRTAAL
jgi:hypothetical protein